MESWRNWTLYIQLLFKYLYIAQLKNWVSWSFPPSSYCWYCLLQTNKIVTFFNQILNLPAAFQTICVHNHHIFINGAYRSGINMTKWPNAPTFSCRRWFEVILQYISLKLNGEMRPYYNICTRKILFGQKVWSISNRGRKYWATYTSWAPMTPILGAIHNYICLPLWTNQ